MARGEATLTTGSTGPEAHSHLQPLVEQILQSTTSDQQLASYLQRHEPLQREFASIEQDRAVELLRRRLEIHPERTGGQIAIQLKFYGVSHDAGSLLVGQILKDFQSEFARWKQEKTSAIQASFDDQHQTAQSHLAEIEGQLRTHREISLKQEQPEQLQRLPNPQWAVVADEMTTIQRKLQSLLETRTPQHPQVVDVQRRIELLEKKLQAIPRHLEPSAESQLLASEVAAEIERRQLRIAALEEQRALAEAQLHSINQLKSDAEEALAFLDGIALHVQANRVHVASVGGVWKPTSVLLLGGWGVFAGLIAFQLAWSAAQPVKIASVQQLAAFAPVPVAAVVSLGSGTESAAKRSWSCRHLSFLLTRAAEAALLITLLVVVLAALTEPGYTQLLRDDPLGAMREAFGGDLPLEN